MKIIPSLLITVIILFCSGYVIADQTPTSTKENQIFDIDTVIDSIGFIDDHSYLKWIIVSNNSTTTDFSTSAQIVSYTTFSDSILSNGGSISENKNFKFNSKTKSSSQFNLELEKVLTYASTEGAHIIGEEEYTLSVAGNFVNNATPQIRCVFSDTVSGGIPAFCNIISAKSSLINMNSAQISSKGQVRAVGGIRGGSGLNYQIAVTPDADSGSGFAEGSVKTAFVGSIMEARDLNDYDTIANWNKTSSENTWKDNSEVIGGISNFQKRFDYKSGVLLI